MSRRRRLDTEEATTVRTTAGKDDDLPAGLLGPLDDHPGPARRLPQSKSAAMIASIVDTAMKDAASADRIDRPEKLGDGTGTIDAPARRAPSRRLVPLLAAALVAAAVVGAAAAVITTRYFTPAPAPQVLPPPSPAAPAPAPSIDEPDDVAPGEIEMEASEIERAAPRPKKVAPPRERERMLPPDAPPEDVLALANQRRKERAWRDADELYRRVIKSHPKSDAAIVAEVASATLHLEHLGDPAGALAGYRRALRARPAGALGEEARWGIAEAYRARSDDKHEAVALRVFLDAHPGSAMAPAARKRLAELEK
jgi:hypothetical protein